MRQRLISILKIVWVCLVFIGAGWYLLRHSDTIFEQLRTIPLWRLAVSSGLLVGGKLFLVQLSRESVGVVQGQQFPFPQMFKVNAMSQLAKYLPGGIWHLVGRAGYYTAENLSASQITWAMIAENIWLVSSAFCLGGATLGLYLLQGQPLQAGIVAAGMIVLDAIAVFVLFRIRHTAVTLQTVGRIVLLQIILWTLIGGSLWALLPDQPNSLLLVISAFLLGWFVGYVSILAPSGLGVRELVLTALLGVIIAPQQALIYATVNRVIWIFTELLLAGVALLLLPREQSSPPNG